MIQLYCDLELIMQKQYELAATLLNETRQQNQALRHNDLEKLNSCVAKIENMGIQMRELDLNREETVSRLAEQLNLTPEAKLSDIAAQAPEDLSTRLHNLRKETRRCLEELKEQVEFNNMLTKNALRFNNMMLGLFRQAAGATYGNSGQVKDTGNFGVTVNKSV